MVFHYWVWLKVIDSWLGEVFIVKERLNIVYFKLSICMFISYDLVNFNASSWIFSELGQ